MDSLLREISEETYLSMEGVPYTVSNKDVKITGVIKYERDLVGEVHFGLVCPIYLDSRIEISLKGKENIRSWIIPLDEYNSFVSSNGLIPESWADLVMENAEKLGIK